MILTNLDKRGRTTVPPEVREALGVEPGDLLAYRIEGGEVIVAKASDEHGPDDIHSAEEIEAALDGLLDDSRPTIPADEAFARAFAAIEEVRRRRCDAA